MTPATGPYLVLVVTDGIGTAWWDGRAHRLLHEWAAESAVVVLTVLPHRMWPGSGIRTSYVPAGQVPDSDRNPVQVLELNAESFERLASPAVSGSSQDGFLILEPPDPQTPATPGPDGPTVVRQFRSTATPIAQRLARYLAAAAPLTLPVMQMIRTTMLPDSDVSHLAEVFLGGLLEEHPAASSRPDPDTTTYEFAPGVRETLLDLASRFETVEVLQLVSDHQGKQLGRTFDVAALLADPTRADVSEYTTVPALAKVTAMILHRLGSQYRGVAARLMASDDDTGLAAGQRLEHAPTQPAGPPRPGVRTMAMDELATLGRDRELAVLHSAVSAAAKGIGGCTIVTGAAGIGKSHLVRAATAEAQRRGVSVAMRAAFELDRAAPLITLASTLQQLTPPEPSVGWLRQEDDAQYRSLERLGTALEDYAAQQPLVIAIDDAQWMDELSALAVAELVPALASSPVRWIFAHRPAPAGTPGQQLLERLMRDGHDQLTLGRLDDDAVRQLCINVVGADVDNTVLALADGCDGNPLQVEQLVRTLYLTGQLVVADGIATVVGEELPSSFITIIDQMLHGLSSETQEMLQAASIFARPFSIEGVAQLLEVRPTTLLKAIKEAKAARILIEEGDGLEFVHDLVRLAIHDTLGDPVATMLHRQAAVVTRAEGRSPIEVAGHLLKTGRLGSREAVTLLRESALAVAPVAPSTAADLIVHALETLTEADPHRVELTADAVGLLASAGRLEQAVELGETALRAGLDPRTEAILLLGLAEAFKHAGQNRTAVEYADRGLDNPDVPTSVQAKLHAIRAHARFYHDDLAGADDDGAQAAKSGLATGEYDAAVFGLCARSLVAQAQGRLDDAYGHADRATDIAKRVRGSAAHRHPRIWLAEAQAALDRFDEAEETLRRGRAESERLGTAWSTPLWHYYNAGLLIARGQLDEAVADAEAGVAVAVNLTAYALAVPLLGQLTRLAVMQGDLPQAEAHLAHLRRRTAAGITAAPEDVVWSEGVLHDAVFGPEAAMRTLRVIYDQLPRRALLISQDPAAAAALVHIAVRAGDAARARTVVAAARALAERNPRILSLAAAADHADGILTGDPSQLRRAVERFRRTPRRLALAAALEDAALDTADLGQSRAWATEAIHIVTECRAERARHRLEFALGGPNAPAEEQLFRPGSPLRQLTPAERSVALKVADGRTNRQVATELFLSRHTVDSHLRKIFNKLGIRSRVELANFVARDRLTS
ncbi:helix-turn-helix transcriptional regulator [Dactylosporangium sp. CA-092794]|uniref:helix-turn-helix transcriptional regulator n=1 Tax=Dactylosporangium sp. CA-092794 TaxID=3239929 RepID=UPI003D8BDB71